MEVVMRKIDRRQLKSIQKKALKDVKRQKNKVPRSSTVVSCDEGMVLLVHNQMDHLLNTDAFVYQDQERHKFVRFPKIRPISHKVR